MKVRDLFESLSKEDKIKVVNKMKSLQENKYEPETGKFIIYDRDGKFCGTASDEVEAEDKAASNDGYYVKEKKSRHQVKESIDPDLEDNLWDVVQGLYDARDTLRMIRRESDNSNFLKWDGEIKALASIIVDYIHK